MRGQLCLWSRMHWHTRPSLHFSRIMGYITNLCWLQLYHIPSSMLLQQIGKYVMLRQEKREIDFSLWVIICFINSCFRGKAQIYRACSPLCLHAGISWYPWGVYDICSVLSPIVWLKLLENIKAGVFLPCVCDNISVWQYPEPRCIPITVSFSKQRCVCFTVWFIDNFQRTKCTS